MQQLAKRLSPGSAMTTLFVRNIGKVPTLTIPAKGSVIRLCTAVFRSLKFTTPTTPVGQVPTPKLFVPGPEDPGTPVPENVKDCEASVDSFKMRWYGVPWT